MCLARLTASVRCLWCLAQVPVTLRGRILALSERFFLRWDVLIIYVLDFFGTEGADLFPLMRAEGLLRFSDFSVHNETILSKRAARSDAGTAYVCAVTQNGSSSSAESSSNESSAFGVP